MPFEMKVTRERTKTMAVEKPGVGSHLASYPSWAYERVTFGRG